MSDKSAIEWTDATWNPTTGCTKVSEGCRHCYIDRTIAFKIGYKPKNGEPVPPRKFDKEGVGGTTGVMLHPERLDQPLRWKRPRRVFVNSLSDLFHDDVTDEFIAMVFATMAEAPWHVFQVLTKRPRRMRLLLSLRTFWETVDEVACDLPDRTTARLLADNPWSPRMGLEHGLPNVWLGTSVEDQKAADLRIPLLLETPAAVRFLSCEPLLGPVELTGGYSDYLGANPGHQAWKVEPAHAPGCNCGEASYTGESPTCPIPEQVATDRVDWVIAGGESGPKARPMHPVWARSLREQCAEASVPFLFKQWGAYRPADNEEGIGDLTFWEDGHSLPSRHTSADEIREVHDAPRFPHGHMSFMVKVGKKKAGRELDGRTWDEFPPLPVVAETAL